MGIANASLTEALEKAEATSLELKGELEVIKKLKSDAGDKSILETQDFEKDEIILKKEQTIEDLKKDCKGFQLEIENKSIEYEKVKASLEASIEDLTKQLSTND